MGNRSNRLKLDHGGDPDPLVALLIYRRSICQSLASTGSQQLMHAERMDINATFELPDAEHLGSARHDTPGDP